MNRRFSRAVFAGFTALGPFLYPAVTFASPTVVPFQATIAIMEQVGPPTITDAHCTLIGTISGTGSASALGPLNVASRDCINPVSSTTFVFVSDNVVLTTADGNQIWAAYGGTLSAGTGNIQGTYFIVGGTGRFKHAKGIGILSGFEAVDFATGTGEGQIQLKGTLSY